MKLHRHRSPRLPLPIRLFGLAVGGVVLASLAPAQGIQFEPETMSQPIGYTPLAGDLDGDGDLDLFGRSTLDELAVAHGDGRGGFTGYSALGLTGINNWLPGDTAEIGDLDGDGDLDVVVSRMGMLQSAVHPLLNDGTGNFSMGTTFLAAGAVRAAALGDLDGDGDLDLVTGSDRAIEVWLNDASGRFPGSRLVTSISAQVADLQLGDVDGDGDLDIVDGNVVVSFNGTSVIYLPAPNVVWRNNGAAGFAPLSFGNSVTEQLQLGDVDGDGDLDAVEREQGAFLVYANNGSGVFTLVQTWPVPWARLGQLADADLDGDLDALAFVVAGGPIHMFVNQGGNFATTPDLARVAAWGTSPNPMFYEPVYGDFDGDGDSDVLCLGLAGFPYRAVLFRNLRRHLAVPAAPRIGQVAPLDHFARYAPATLALPFVSLGPASIPLPPLGTVGIDPAQAAALPWLSLPPATGSGTVPLPIPNALYLVGLSFYAQTLFIDGTNHVSNVRLAVIAP